MKFTKLILLLISVLFSLLNGCGGDEEEEFETLKAGETLTVDTAGEITDIKFNAKWIVVSNPLAIHIYNKEKELRASLTGHEGIVQTIALSEESEGSFFIAVGCSDGTIRIWDAAELGKKIDSKKSNEILIFTKDSTEYYKDIKNQDLSGIQTLAFSHKDRNLAIGDKNGRIKLWNIQRFWDNGLEEAASDICGSAKSHTGTITALTFSNNRPYFASGSRDKKVQIWGTEGCRSIKTYSNEAGQIAALMFLPIDQFLDMKGAFLVGGGTGSQNKGPQIILWHVEEGISEEKDNVQEFTLNNGQDVTALTFLKDRNLLVAGTNNSDIYAWDITNIDPEGKPSGSFQESHQSSITALASLHNGTILASGSEDGIIHILDPDDDFIPSEQQ